MKPTQEYLDAKNEDAFGSYISGGYDRDLVVGRRYFVRVGCDSRNWFQAAYLGVVGTEYTRFLHFDNDVYAEEGGCGTAVYDPELPA